MLHLFMWRIDVNMNFGEMQLCHCIIIIINKNNYLIINKYILK